MYDESLRYQIVFFSFFLLFAFLALVLMAFVLYKLQKHDKILSPYTKKPTWRAESISLDNAKEIMRFLYYDIHTYDNRIFLLKRAVVCRDTGRIFQDVISPWGFAKLDWTFLSKRYPGIYVSWGSLSLVQQREIREAHYSLEGFQTEKSSTRPLPQDCEEYYIHLSPGPLYVDITTQTLLGWQRVPNTMFEVLIVQHPIKKEKSSKDRLTKYRDITIEEFNEPT